MREITLWNHTIPYDTPSFDTPNRMTFYPVTTWHPLPAVIIFPGGGYSNRVEHEGANIAQYYNSRGFHAFVVDYRTLPHQYPCALIDAQRAVKLVRAHAEQYRVNPDMLFTIGFSAGGHLSGCLAVFDDICKVGDEYDDISPRPTGVMMGYPVVSTEQCDDSNAHTCVLNILKNAPAETLSLEKHVTPDTVPCFLWHTSEDEIVSVTHSLKFCEALRAQHVPFELHVYPHGRHGLALALNYYAAEEWPENSVRWMRGFRK